MTSDCPGFPDRRGIPCSLIDHFSGSLGAPLYQIRSLLDKVPDRKTTSLSLESYGFRSQETPGDQGNAGVFPPRPQSLGPSGALAGLNPRCLICNCVNNILRWDIIAHTQKVGVTNILLPGGLMDCLLWSTRARVMPSHIR